MYPCVLTVSFPSRRRLKIVVSIKGHVTKGVVTHLLYHNSGCDIDHEAGDCDPYACACPEITRSEVAHISLGMVS